MKCLENSENSYARKTCKNLKIKKSRRKKCLSYEAFKTLTALEAHKTLEPPIPQNKIETSKLEITNFKNL